MHRLECQYKDAWGQSSSLSSVSGVGFCDSSVPGSPFKLSLLFSEKVKQNSSPSQWTEVNKGKITVI